MDKKTLFDQAMKAGYYKDLRWLIRAFSVSRKMGTPTPGRNVTASPPLDSQAHVQKTTAWEIESDVTGHYVYDDQLVKHPIDDTVADKPAFHFNDLVTIGPDNIPNLQEEMETTYGNWFANWLLLVHPFGTKIPYMDGDITGKRIESKILYDFRDNVKPGQKEDPKAFYVREYLLFGDAMYFLTGMTQLAVWAATEKSILPAPGMNQLRDQLVEKNKANIDDLATIATITKELGAHDRKYLEGDPGAVFLKTSEDKSFDVVRMKKFNMYGPEVGMADNAVKATLVKKSLYEGWEIDKFPVMNDSARAGSFNRGFQTQLGGVQVKWILRATSNFNITIDDCDSWLGKAYLIDKTNLDKIIGYYLVQDTGSVLVKNPEEAEQYLGKVVHRRSPMYCKLPGTDLCKACVGTKLAVSPEGLSLAASAYGSTIMYIFMQAGHGKKLATAKMNFLETIT